MQKGAKLIPVRSFAEPSGKKIVVFPVLVIIYYYREYCTSNMIIKIGKEGTKREKPLAPGTQVSSYQFFLGL